MRLAALIALSWVVWSVACAGLIGRVVAEIDLNLLSHVVAALH